MRTLRLLILCSLVLLPLRAADPALLNMARPDSNLVMGIDVAAFTSSPWFREALQQAGSKSDDVGKMMAALGPQPWQNLHEIVITAKLDQFNGDTEPKNFLIAARGVFDGPQFTDMLCQQGCESEDYRDFQLLRLSDGAKQMYFTALDSQYAALGAYDDVRQAVDRRAMATQSVFDAGMQNSIGRLSRNHLWLATRGPFQDAMGGAGGGMVPPDTVSKIVGLGLGVFLGRDVDLTLELSSVSDQDAKQLYDMANGFLALMKAGDNPPETTAMLNSLQLQQDGPMLAASVRIPEAQIRQQMAEKMGQYQDGGVAPGQPAGGAQQDAPPPPPAKRRDGGIRIFGLEEEPVEVPTDNR